MKEPRPLVQLGRLGPVDLRDVWESEPYGFTPWLASEENLNDLAEALGIGALELVSTEEAVSEFSVDIVARIAGTDALVAIENQLEKSDHIHLGQAVTYAAGTEARVVVWIARKFKEGHLAALEWLNRKTTDDVAFFGVELSAVRIGDSLPAPRFDVVVKPNEWARLVRDRANAGELSAENERNLEYWQAYDRIASAHGVRHGMARLPIGTNYYTYFGRTGVGMSVFLARARSNVGVYVFHTDPDAHRILDRLMAEQKQIEQEIGATLNWRRLPSGFHIVFSISADADEKAVWEEQHLKLANAAAKLRAVFEPKIAALESSGADTDG